MYVQAQLLNGYKKPLWYKIPETFASNISLGSIIIVPLRNKTVSASVMFITDKKPTTLLCNIKYAIAHEPFIQDTFYHQFITAIASYQHIDPIHIIKRIKSFIEQKKVALLSHKKEPATSKKTLFSDVTLTSEQQTVCKYIFTMITKNKFAPTVIHGVTGSGKTECYKKAIIHTIENNKSALLLFPEISLAITFQERLKKELPHIPIFGFHSGKTTKEKRMLWEELQKKSAILIIGVHLPVFLPIANLGIIVIDEEHEVGYQEKKYPKIHTKNAAIMRAHIYNIPIILGSATPTITTLYNVQNKNWKLFTLKKRFKSTFPSIEKVSLLENKQRRFFWITQKLQKALAQNIQKKEQSIIFINRRGVSFFVQCKQCSFIFNCNSCSVSLTLHEQDILMCHYCGTKKLMPHKCTACTADKTYFLKKGAGTQSIVSALKVLFPNARIARADLDITAKKKAWQETVKKMHANEIDILVGTQTITKGLHFQNVTLVGIIWADLHLHLPIYNAAETALQQIIQVAGRAGRAGQKSTVIVQTMGSHPIFDFIDEQNYLSFFSKEIENRKLFSYPPFTRLAELEIKHTNEIIVIKEAEKISCSLRSHAKKNALNMTILGPSKPPVYKIKHTFSRKIYIKHPNITTIITAYDKVKKMNLKSTISFTPNPMSL